MAPAINLDVIRNEVPMKFYREYDGKFFCTGAESSCSSAESKPLEWTGKMHNRILVLAKRARSQSIYAIEIYGFIESVINCTVPISAIENAIAMSFTELNELSELKFLEVLRTLVKKFLKKFSAV